MRTSNKVLLAAIAALMALFLAFVLTMSFTIRNLMQQRGRTAHAARVPVAELSYTDPGRATECGPPAPVSAPPRPIAGSRG
jgi:hypothetical protein